MISGTLRRVYWRLLRAIGLKQLSWDKQFEAGVWCRRPRSPKTIQHVEELCRGGYLVEFGCGEGTLPLALKEGTFSRYVGYDISAVAVRTAAQAVQAAGRANCEFHDGDMAKWEGASGASLIVAEECLYYLPAEDAETFLQRCSASLTEDGSILVIVHSAVKHATTLETCRRVCQVRSESDSDGRTFLVLASRKKLE